MLIISIILLWIACGLVNYGGMFAFFQREFPCIAEKNRNRDKSFCNMAFATGPWGLIPTILVSRFFKHGFKFK